MAYDQLTEIFENGTIEIVGIPQIYQ